MDMDNSFNNYATVLMLTQLENMYCIIGFELVCVFKTLYKYWY